MSPPGDRLACPWCDETGVESGDACRLCGGPGVIYLDEIAQMRRLYDCARPPTATDLAAIAVEIFGQEDGEP